MKESTRVRAPKQERSRLSFERAVDAALALMVERRSDAFTLADVVGRAGVSIGSIYGRVDSKDDLIHAAFEREMDRIAREQHEAFSASPQPGETLTQAVDQTIRITAAFLRANANVLAPFMAIGNHDEHFAQRGKIHFNEMVDAFTARILEHRTEIGHHDPPAAARWSHTVVFSVLARWLGLGSEPEAAGEGDWDVVLDNLTEMVTAFLMRQRAGHAQATS